MKIVFLFVISRTRETAVVLIIVWSYHDGWDGKRIRCCLSWWYAVISSTTEIIILIPLYFGWDNRWNWDDELLLFRVLLKWKMYF